MALQLNKISRGLLQNRRFIASVEVLGNNKELHADCSSGAVPEAVKTIPVHNGSKLSLVEAALSRGYSTKTKKGRCKMAKCPKFFLEGCECPRCEKRKPVPCKKRLAPYPSYSEACVEELDDDPSECVQCPWKHCPDFHPKFRGYHTAPALEPSSVNKVINQIHFYEKKAPCPKPMGPCERRRRLQERLRKEQEKEECEREKEKRKRKCMSWTEAVAKLYNKQNNMDLMNNQELLLVKKIYKKQIHPCEESFDAFEYDPREADYAHKSRRKRQDGPPCCPKKGKSRKVQDCPPRCRNCRCCKPYVSGGLIEEINMQLESGHSKCPKKKKHYPEVDNSYNCAGCEDDCPPEKPPTRIKRSYEECKRTKKKQKLPCKDYPQTKDYPHPICVVRCPRDPCAKKRKPSS